ncbi:MAG: nucleotide-binding universal stress UspA family protein [Verrucomicrobiales bacterium]|jgi:nucleotide-binding universal stress UspA family protein
MKTQIQRILVPLDPSEYTDAATARACEVAKPHQATLTGLAVLDSPGIRGSVAPSDTLHWPLVQDTILGAEAHARERIAAAREKFDRTCVEQGVKHAASQLEGVPAEVIHDASGLYDLVVMGLRTFFHFETRDEPGDSLDKLLGQTATPILAVPKDRPASPFLHALVAYDGSMNASRALKEFAAFAAPFDFQITVLTATEDDRQAEMLLHEAIAYLADHGIDNVETKRSKQKAVTIDTLGDADLVVAGIHSKRFFKDRFVGSLTTELIERHDRALFLSH